MRHMLTLHGSGKYGKEIDKLAAELGIKRLRLYQTANPKETSHFLSPHLAMRLEVLTDGLVPCESTNPHMAEIIAATKELIEFRAA